MRIFNTFILVLFSFGAFFSSCQKFLEMKPSSDISIPNTEEDLQALLNYTLMINGAEPGIGEIASDDYFLLDQGWAEISNVLERDLYLWKKVPTVLGQWFGPYTAVMYANTILDNIDNVTFKNRENYNQIKGSAIFHRARSYYRILHVYSVAYRKEIEDDHLGFVIRKSGDIEEVSNRLTLNESYKLLREELTKAAAILNVVEKIPTHPTKSASYSILSNICMELGDFEQAYKYADSAIIYNPRKLLDYNTDVQLDATIPFSRFNDEVIFYSTINGSLPINPLRAKVSKELIGLYGKNDLRKQAFFRLDKDGYHVFKGNYEGNVTTGIMFSGITVAELYLQKAETAARIDEMEIALGSLNTLRKARISTSGFQPFMTNDKEELIDEILKERRKELAFRGRRWQDIRRLACEGRFNVSLIREINGEVYKLTLDQLKNYAFQIPDGVIDNSNLEQNK